MKILVIGGGGREHALVWKLAQDSCRPELYCAPGNAGTAELATNVPIAADDVKSLQAWVVENRPDLTVVGPEAPLCLGIADTLGAAGFRVFGPSKAAARMEGSKVFAKDVMLSAGVPTAASKTFTDATRAIAYVGELDAPVVIKADGLAAGKGVTVCADAQQAEAAIRESLVAGGFGEAGKTVLVEETLTGEEASILALIDGESIVMLASSQDHKRVFDNDKGPNTGGMGAYSPAPLVTDDMWPRIRRCVFEPTLAELKKRGITYKGVLYAGLMIDGSGGMKVLEFNCRFGDPETQAVIMRLSSDLVPALEACVDGTLSESLVKWRPEAAVCVVMTAGGYPGSYVNGRQIEGLDRVKGMDDVVVFHAGTGFGAAGKVVSAGGRVLGVTGLGLPLSRAVSRTYEAVAAVNFADAHYRRDIAAKALKGAG